MKNPIDCYKITDKMKDLENITYEHRQISGIAMELYNIVDEYKKLIFDIAIAFGKDVVNPDDLKFIEDILDKLSSPLYDGNALLTELLKHKKEVDDN